jgi:FixJ family two-component response regulator
MHESGIVSIVDDDESVRSSLEDLMCSLGFTVRAFDSVEGFLNSPARARTACLITDLQMPGMNGEDLQRCLLSENNAPPIIFITAFPEEHVRESVIANGAVAFLEKPWDMETLIGLVRETMAPRR